MKLSEAILLGSIGSEQGFGNESAVRGSKNKCVIGTALLAIGDEGTLPCVIWDDSPYSKLEKHWPWVTKEVSIYTLPRGIGCLGAKITIALFTLNDTYKWTRPQIAAWVATIEPQEPQEPLLLPDLTSTHLLEVGKQVGCK